MKKVCELCNGTGWYGDNGPGIAGNREYVPCECKNKTNIEKCKELFESICCLCAEGPEFHTKMELVELISKDAVRGYELCKNIKAREVKHD